MKGSTEERLTQLLGEAYGEYEELFICNLLNNECKELQPWQPMTGQACAWNNIESAPKDRDVLLLLDNGQVISGYWGNNKWVSELIVNDGYYAQDLYPTHWQELPADPK